MSAATVAVQHATIRQYAKRLQLATLGGQFAQVAEQAVKEKKSHLSYLEALLEAEVEERERNTVARRIRDARIEKVSEIFRKALQHFGHVPFRKDEYNLWVGRIPNRNTLETVVLSTEANLSKRDIQEHAKYLFAMIRSRFESFDKDDSYNRQRWEDRWHGYNLPNPIEVKHVTSIVARLVLCSLERIPRGRVAGALPSYTADENGQVLSLSTSVNVSYQKSLPASISVCVMDGIKSTSSAIEKSQELKTIFH